MGVADDLGRAIGSATADGVVTIQEWQSSIEPLADSTPLDATDSSREVLQLWADDRFQIDPQVRQWMQAFLDSRGYDCPDQRPTGIDTTTLVHQIEDTNVGEIDRDFQSVVTAAGRTDAKVNICVEDNGFDLFNPELGHKGWVNPNGGTDPGMPNDGWGWDFVDWNNDVGNPNGDWHGTHVAGIATRGTDQLAVIPCRVINSPYDVNKVVEAADFAASKGAKVINMSFGIDTPERVQAMRECLARHPDVLFVIAAGNDNRTLDSYGADNFLADDSYPNLCVVAASDANGNKASFSNYGSEANLAARGTDVLSTIPGASYGKISGTSMAAPEVVNIAGKCLVLDPGLTPVQLKQLMTDTTDVNHAWDGLDAADGVVDPARAYKLAGLTGLVRRGATLVQAADQLGLTGDERSQLLSLVPKYVS